MEKALRRTRRSSLHAQIRRAKNQWRQVGPAVPMKRHASSVGALLFYLDQPNALSNKIHRPIRMHGRSASNRATDTEGNSGEHRWVNSRERRGIFVATLEHGM